MRASIMMHLPALSMTDQMKRVVGAVSQFGLAVRGIYGEGTDVLGNIYQMSNQVTLGHTEEEIIEHLLGVTR
jgi:protein arginine kinase